MQVIQNKYIMTEAWGLAIVLCPLTMSFCWVLLFRGFGGETALQTFPGGRVRYEKLWSSNLPGLATTESRVQGAGLSLGGKREGSAVR